VALERHLLGTSRLKGGRLAVIEKQMTASLSGDGGHFAWLNQVST
jgi:hypothetical protein